MHALYKNVVEVRDDLVVAVEKAKRELHSLVSSFVVKDISPKDREVIGEEMDKLNVS